MTTAEVNLLDVDDQDEETTDASLEGRKKQISNQVDQILSKNEDSNLLEENKINDISTCESQSLPISSTQVDQAESNEPQCAAEEDCDKNVHSSVEEISGPVPSVRLSRRLEVYKGDISWHSLTKLQFVEALLDTDLSSEGKNISNLFNPALTVPPPELCQTVSAEILAQRHNAIINFYSQLETWTDKWQKKNSSDDKITTKILRNVSNELFASLMTSFLEELEIPVHPATIFIGFLIIKLLMPDEVENEEPSFKPLFHKMLFTMLNSFLPAVLLWGPADSRTKTVNDQFEGHCLSLLQFHAPEIASLYEAHSISSCLDFWNIFLLCPTDFTEETMSDMCPITFSNLFKLLVISDQPAAVPLIWASLMLRNSDDLNSEPDKNEFISKVLKWFFSDLSFLSSKEWTEHPVYTRIWTEAETLGYSTPETFARDYDCKFVGFAKVRHKLLLTSEQQSNLSPSPIPTDSNAKVRTPSEKPTYKSDISEKSFLRVASEEILSVLIKRTTIRAMKKTKNRPMRPSTPHKKQIPRLQSLACLESRAICRHALQMGICLSVDSVEEDCVEDSAKILSAWDLLMIDCRGNADFAKSGLRFRGAVHFDWKRSGWTIQRILAKSREQNSFSNGSMFSNRSSNSKKKFFSPLNRSRTLGAKQQSNSIILENSDFTSADNRSIEEMNYVEQFLLQFENYRGKKMGFFGETKTEEDSLLVRFLMNQFHQRGFSHLFELDGGWVSLLGEINALPPHYCKQILASQSEQVNSLKSVRDPGNVWTDSKRLIDSVVRTGPQEVMKTIGEITPEFSQNLRSFINTESQQISDASEVVRQSFGSLFTSGLQPDTKVDSPSQSGSVMKNWWSAASGAWSDLTAGGHSKLASSIVMLSDGDSSIPRADADDMLMPSPHVTLAIGEDDDENSYEVAAQRNSTKLSGVQDFKGSRQEGANLRSVDWDQSEDIEISDEGSRANNIYSSGKKNGKNEKKWSKWNHFGSRSPSFENTQMSKQPQNSKSASQEVTTTSNPPFLNRKSSGIRIFSSLFELSESAPPDQSEATKEHSSAQNDNTEMEGTFSLPARGDNAALRSSSTLRDDDGASAGKQADEDPDDDMEWAALEAEMERRAAVRLAS